MDDGGGGDSPGNHIALHEGIAAQKFYLFPGVFSNFGGLLRQPRFYSSKFAV